MERKKHDDNQSAYKIFNFRNITTTVLLILIVALMPTPNQDAAYVPVYRLIAQQFTNSHAVMPENADWLFEVHVDRVVDKRGTMSAYEADYELAVELSVNGQELSGDYLASTGNACATAHMAGVVDGDQISWVVTYSGTCCDEAQMEFNGTLSADARSFTGNFEPIGTPPDMCLTWWATVDASIMD